MNQKMATVFRTLVILILLLSQLQIVLTAVPPETAAASVDPGSPPAGVSRQTNPGDCIGVDGFILNDSAVPDDGIFTAPPSSADLDYSARKAGDILNVVVFIENTSGQGGCGTIRPLQNVSVTVTFFGSNQTIPPNTPRNPISGSPLISRSPTLVHPAGSPAHELTNRGDRAYALFQVAVPNNVEGTNLFMRTRGTATYNGTAIEDYDNEEPSPPLIPAPGGVAVLGPGVVLDSFTANLSQVGAGEPVQFTITVRNTRDLVDVNSLAFVADDPNVDPGLPINEFQAAEDACGLGDGTQWAGLPLQDVGDTASCTFTVDAPSWSPLPPNFQVTGTVTASDGATIALGNPVEIDVASVSVDIFVPKIGVEKSVVRVSRPSDPAYVWPTGGAAMPGDTVVYEVVVTNLAGAGGISLNRLVVIDSMLGRRPNPAGSEVLDPGETATYSYSYTIKQTDRSPLTNRVTATATGIGVSETVSASAAVAIPLLTSQLEVDLTANPVDAAPGSQVTYTATIHNAGTTSLWDLAYVTLDPPTLSDAPLPALPVGALTEGATVEVSWVYTIPNPAPPAEPPDPVVNRIRITANATDHAVVAEDQVVVNVVNPDLTVAVTVLKPTSGAILRGGDAEFLVTVTKPAGATVCNVVVTEKLRDPDLGTETIIVPSVPMNWPGTPGYLPADAAPLTGTTTYRVTDNKDPLQIVFEVNGDDCTVPTPEALKDRATATIDISDAQVNADLSAETGPDGVVMVTEGETTFNLNVINTGALTLDDLEMTYTVFGATPFSSDPDNPLPLLPMPLLALGDPAGTSFTYDFEAADASVSPVLVEAYITGVDDTGKTVSITASTTVQVVTIELGIELGIQGPQEVVEKDTRTFTFAVRNLTTGPDNEPLALNDLYAYNLNEAEPSPPGPEPYPGLVPFKQVGYIESLSSRGAVFSGTFTDVIEPSQIKGGSFTLSLLVIGRKDDNSVVTATMDVEFSVIPQLEVVKTADRESVIPGYTVTYTLSIINNSVSQTLTLTTVEDSLYPITANSFSSQCGTWDGGTCVLNYVGHPDGHSTATITYPYLVDPNDSRLTLQNTFHVVGARQADGASLEASVTESVSLTCPIQVAYRMFNTDIFDAGSVPYDILGETILWEISLVNTSSGTVTVGSVRDTLKWPGQPDIPVAWPGAEKELGPIGSDTDTAYVQDSDPALGGKPSFLMQITPEFYGELPGGEDDYMEEIITIVMTQEGATEPRECVYNIEPYYLFSPIQGFKEPDKFAAFAGDTVTYSLQLENVAEPDEAPWDTYFITNVTDTLTKKQILLPFDPVDGVYQESSSGTLESTTTTTTNPTAPPDGGVKLIPYPVQQTDPNPLKNTVTVSFQDALGNRFYTQIEAPPVETTNPLEVIKRVVDDGTPPARGETITYEFQVRNRGTYPLEEVSVYDELLGEYVISDVSLEAGDVYPPVDPVTRDYTIGATDPDPLPNTAVGTAIAWIPDPHSIGYLHIPIENRVTVTVDLEDAKLSIEKTVWDEFGAEIEPTNGLSSVDVGAPFQYCFDVTNLNSPGLGAISDIVVEDPALLNFGIDQTMLQGYFTARVADLYPGHANNMLLGGETVHFCTPLRPATGVEPDPLTNTVTIRGRSEAASPGTYDVVESDQAVVDFKGTAIEISDSVTSSVAFAGDTVTYTLTIHNKYPSGSNYPITVDEITDSYLGSSDINPQIFECFRNLRTNETLAVNAVLMANDTARCQYDRLITITDPSTLITTSTVAGVLGGDGGDVAVEDSTLVSIAVTASQLLVRKTASKSVAQPGETIDYRIAITNIGKTPVLNLTTTDADYLDGGVPVVLTRPDPLLPYQTQFYNYSLTMPVAVGGFVARDPFINTVTVEGDVLGSDGKIIVVDGQAHTLRVVASASVDILQSAMRVTKRAQQDAATYGSPINYDVTILNTGDETINGVVVTDVTVPGGLTFTLDAANCSSGNPDRDTECPFWFSSTSHTPYLEDYDGSGIPAGEEITGTIPVQVLPPANSNQFTNVVQVTGVVGADTIQDSSSATIDVREEGIGVEKVASVTEAPVGGTVYYTVTVTNTGSENAKINRLVFYDPAIPEGTDVDFSGDDFGSDGVLESGDTFSMPPYAYRLKLGDSDPFVNQVSVRAYTTTGAMVIGTAQASVDVQPVRVEIDKIACVGTDTDPGVIDSTMIDPCGQVLSATNPDRSVTYYLHITNPGTLPINNLEVTDPTAPPAAITAINTALETETLDDSADDIWVKYVVTVPANATDPYQNMVTVSAQAPIDPANPTEPPLTVYDSDRASINLVSSNLYLSKSASVAQGLVGTEVTYTLRIENLAAPGGEDITGIVVTDPMNVDPTSDCNTLETTLSAGEYDTCTFRHVLALSDPSPLINTAFVSGTQASIGTISDQASATVSIIRLGGLSIEKIPDHPTARIGDPTPVGFTYIIRNTGSLELRNLTIDDLDPLVGAFEGDIPDTLIPSQQVVLRAYRSRPFDATDPDPYINTVTVSAEATTLQGVRRYTAETTAQMFISNSDLVVSNMPLTTFVNEGGTATFTYSVTNLSDAPVTALTFNDGGLCSGLPSGETLGIGATRSFVCNVPNAQLPGPIVSNLYVSALDSTNATISDSASAQVGVLPASGGIYVTKTASVPFAAVGEMIDFVITVQNVGNEPLIFDSDSIDESIPSLFPSPAVTSPLAPGESFTLRAPFEIVGGMDQQTNTVTVTAEGQNSGQTYTGQATVSVGILLNPSAQLAVTQNVSYGTPVQPGTSTLVYTWRVRNIGSSAISGAEIRNAQNAPVPGLDTIAIPDNLQPGTNWTISRTITVPASWSNVRLINTAEVWRSGETSADDNATTDVPVQLFTVTKAPVTTEPTLVGNPVQFTVVVTNLSTSPIAATVEDTPTMTGYTQAIPVTWTPALPATFPGGATTLTAEMIVPRFNAPTLDNEVIVSVGGVEQGRAAASAPLFRTDIDIVDGSVQVYQTVTNPDTTTTNLLTIQTGEQATVVYDIANLGVTRITGLTHSILFDIPGVTCTPTGPTELAPYGEAGSTGQVSCTFTVPEASLSDDLTHSVNVRSAGTGEGDAVDDTGSDDFDLIDLQLGIDLQVILPSGTTGALPNQSGVLYRILITNNGDSPVGCDATVPADNPCHLHMTTTDTRLAGLLDAARPGGAAAINADFANQVFMPGATTQFYYDTNPFTIGLTETTSTVTLVVDRGGYYDPSLGSANQYYTLHTTQDSATLTILRPSISVTVQASTTTPTVDSNITFTVTIRNTGPVRVENLSGTWMINMTAADLRETGGIMLVDNPRRQSSGLLAISPTFLEPNQSVVAVVSKQEDLERPYVFTATVNGSGISSSGSVSQAGSVNVTPVVPVTPAPTQTVSPQGTLDPNAVDPIVTKTASVDAAQPGDTVIWTITVRNGGTNPITNVSVSDPVPDTLIVNSATTTLGTALVDGQSVTATTGTLSPGAIVTLTVNTTVGDNVVGPAEISNVVCAARDGGQQMCATDTVAVGADVEGLPATGIHDTPQDSAGSHLPALLGIFFSGALMILMSAQISNRRLVVAAAFLVIALGAVVGAVVLMMSDSDKDNDDQGKDTPVAVVPDTTPGAETPQVNNMPTFVFPPTATVYIAPKPVGPRYLMIPKLGEQFQAPIPIVSMPIKDRQWDVSGLGYYVGWLEGTTWLEPTWGNTVLAAHVQLGTANPGPFWGLNTLQPGDEIIVIEGEQESHFVVDNITAVEPSDWTVTAPTTTPTLTLLTCTNWDESYGVFSERLVVRAVPA